mmetsp:Transcript_10665/g.35374  ORF Transcript_10665/g.35374 Transcript_10665/m.35374 type:complete len:167 (-) Transcript_10665:71-571(-)
MPSRSQQRRLPQSAAPSADTAAAATPSALSLGLVEVRDTGCHTRGHGLFAAAPLPDGAYLGDYTGEVLTQEEYLARYPDEDARYVLAASADWNIDAAEAGSSSLLRYVNHSSSPNCYYHVERVRRSPARRVSFYTLRPVRPGEELLFDYGKEFWRGRCEEQVGDGT